MLGDKDLYEILGLTPAASPEQIKSAFRSLAQKYHPDSQDGQNHDVALFVAITEAYETLSDPDLRNEYNKTRGFEHYEEVKIAGSGFEQRTVAPEVDGQKVDLSAERISTAAVFNSISANENATGFRVGQKASIELAEGLASEEGDTELEEVTAWGEQPIVDKKSKKKSIFSFGAKVGSMLTGGNTAHLKRQNLKNTLKSRMSEEPDRELFTPSKKPQNPNIKKEETKKVNVSSVRGERLYNFQVSKLEALVGTTRKLALEGRDGQPVMREVNIPAGTIDGQTLEVSWGWERAKIRVSISLEPLWDIRGQDIFLRLPVTLEEVIEGAELTIPCFAGQCRIQLSSGMNLLEPIRIQGKGLLRRGKSGDLVVMVCVVPPNSDSPMLRAASQALESAYVGDVRGKLFELIKDPSWFWTDEVRSYLQLPVTFSEALWGASVEISIDNDTIKVDVPKFCTPENVIQVDLGDLALCVLPVVILPENMDLNARAATKAIGQLYNSPVRKNLPKKFSVE